MDKLVETLGVEPADLRSIPRSYTVDHKMVKGVLEIHTVNEETY